MTKFDFWKWCLSVVIGVASVYIAYTEVIKGNLVVIVLLTIIATLALLAGATFLVLLVQKYQAKTVSEYMQANSVENKTIVDGIAGLAKSMAAYSNVMAGAGGGGVAPMLPDNNSSGEAGGGLIIDMPNMQSYFLDEAGGE